MNDSQKTENRVETTDDDSRLDADGWSHNQPSIGGRWLWREGDNCEEVELTLSADGASVEKSADDEPEGTPQFYWEQTETTQRVMPGLWKRIDPISHSVTPLAETIGAQAQRLFPHRATSRP